MQLENRARLICCMAAFISFTFSIYLWFSGQRDEGLFVGLWVPSILASGAILLPSISRQGENDE